MKFILEKKNITRSAAIIDEMILISGAKNLS